MSGKGPEKHAVVLNRPPKGHRQRGAGTVIVSKPPVLTDDGILLKPFERLPTTLLQEFSQRERRIMPKYNQCRRSSDDDEEDTDAAAKYKFEVHLEDKKNSKFDLKFTPNQSFSSEKVAKDFAALLALWHFQKTLPLENKLPEPYRTTWLGMIAAENESKPVAPPRGSKASESKAAAATEAKADSKAAPVSVSKIPKSTSADKLTSASSSKQPVTAAPVVPEAVVKPAVVKTPPSAVLNLLNERKFVSASEIEQLEIAKRAELTKLNSMQLAFNEANKPPVITLSDELARKLQSLLQLEDTASLANKPRQPKLQINKQANAANIYRAYGITDRCFEHLSRAPGLFETLCALQSLICPSPSTSLYSTETLDEEIESLAAIYPQTFSYKAEEKLMQIRLENVALPSSEAALYLDIHILHSSEEGTALTLFPVIRSESPTTAETELCHLLALQVELWRFAITLEHPPIVYDLLIHLEATAAQGETFFTGSTETEMFYKLSGITPIEAFYEEDASMEGTYNETRINSVRYNSISFWDRSLPRGKSVSGALGNPNLPAFQSKQEFLSLLAGYAAIVVTGETGSGKTTQIPQFIVEQYPTSKTVVCQPRRLAATSVAIRVAEEMKTKVGDKVGYMVRGDSKASTSTQILFCTYGVMLRRMQDDPDLAGIDYIILDEVHERGMDSDFAFALLLIVIERRQKGSTPLKLIIMSATISTDKFALYIGNSVLQGQRAPILAIPGFTFPVTDYYKQNYESVVRSSFGYLSRARSGDDDDGNSAKYAYRIGGREKKGDTDYDLLIRLLLCLMYGSNGEDVDPVMLAPAEGAILVFMKGVPEINRVIMLLEECLPQVRGARIKVTLLPLHSNLSSADQKKVFRIAQPNEIKVVVSTNIAEASVTIPDVTVVVDSCRVKELNYDMDRQMTSLESKLAAQDALRQRRGRAGRVREGRCFKLVSEQTFLKLPVNSTPEMLRIPLDQLVLQTMSMELGQSYADTLARCIDPPHPDALDSAFAGLMKLQAIDMTTESLSILGRYLSALPCSPKVGRLLVYGALFGVVLPATTAAATVSSKSPYLMANDAEIKKIIESHKMRIIDSSLAGYASDHLILIKAVEEYEASWDRRRYCQANGLSNDAMSDILDLRKELLEALVSVGLITSVQEGFDKNSQVNKFANEISMVSAVLCSGVYPQAARVIRPPKRFLEVSGGNVEKDLEANELKFYIPYRPDENVDDSAATGVITATSIGKSMQHVQLNTISIYKAIPLQNINYVIYGERNLVNYNLQKIPYINYLSPVSPIALLLFFGRVETSEDTILVDGWIRLAGAENVRILLLALKERMDESVNEILQSVWSGASRSTPFGIAAIADLLIAEMKIIR